MNNILSGIKNTIYNIFSGIIFLPKTIYYFIDQLINDGRNLHVKLKNITQSNIDLGKYHLKNGNYNDAIFRFKLVDKFLDKNNAIVNYYLGVTYFLKTNYAAAIIHLSKPEVEDKLGLLNFIRNIDNIDQVPLKIYKKHREINAKNFIDKFASEDINIPQSLLLEFNKVNTTLPDQYNILEIGSNIGLLGFEISRRMQDEFKVISTEISKEMIDIQSVLYPDQQLYDEIFYQSAEEYFNKNSQKYDVIFSLDGFSYFKDLKAIFTKIYSFLNNNGYFTFCVRTSDNPGFSKELLEFSYDFDKLSENLIETGFKILSYKKFNLENKNNYTILICSKQI